MKKALFVKLALTATFLSSAGNALATIYPDTTLVLEGHSRSDAWGNWVDVSGDPAVYGVSSVEINKSGNSVQFSLHTNYPGQSTLVTQSDGTAYYTYLADFAIDTNSDGEFDMGVVLKDHSQWTNGVAPTKPDLSAGVYAVNSWDKSSHFFEESIRSSTGGIAYGEYYWAGNGTATPPVAIAGGTLLAGLTVSQDLNSALHPDSTYIYSFVIDSSLLPNEFAFFWGGDNGASDIITGTASVPEPATIMLFGSGLLGVLGLGRKRLFS